MVIFYEFYKSLDSDSGVIRKQFEKFDKWFLKTAPVWKSQVKEVWLRDEHLQSFECGGPNNEIHLVFTANNFPFANNLRS